MNVVKNQTLNDYQKMCLSIFDTFQLLFNQYFKKKTHIIVKSIYSSLRSDSKIMFYLIKMYNR